MAQRLTNYLAKRRKTRLSSVLPPAAAGSPAHGPGLPQERDQTVQSPYITETGASSMNARCCATRSRWIC